MREFLKSLVSGLHQVFLQETSAHWLIGPCINRKPATCNRGTYTTTRTPLNPFHFGDKNSIRMCQSIGESILGRQASPV